MAPSAPVTDTTGRGRPWWGRDWAKCRKRRSLMERRSALSLASVKSGAGRGEGEWHLGVVASRGNNSRPNRHHAGKRQSGGAKSQSHVWDFSTNGGSSTYANCFLSFLNASANYRLTCLNKLKLLNYKLPH